MAIYTYRCPRCGATAEVWQSIKSYCEAPDVPVCPGGNIVNEHIPYRDWHGPMERYFTVPMTSMDIAPWAGFVSPIDGSAITSRSERNEHMARHGVVMYDEIAPDIERNRKARLAEAQADLKKEVIVAAQRVEQGYVPKVDSIDNFVPSE